MNHLSATAFKMLPESPLLCFLELQCFMFIPGCSPPALCSHFKVRLSSLAVYQGKLTSIETG